MENTEHEVNLNLSAITRHAALQVIKIWDELPSGIDDAFLAGVIGNLAALTGGSADKDKISERLAELLVRAAMMIDGAEVIEHPEDK